MRTTPEGRRSRPDNCRSTLFVRIDIWLATCTISSPAGVVWYPVRNRSNRRTPSFSSIALIFEKALGGLYQHVGLPSKVGQSRRCAARFHSRPCQVCCSYLKAQISNSPNSLTKLDGGSSSDQNSKGTFSKMHVHIIHAHHTMTR